MPRSATSITYTYVVTNTGNVTFSGPLTVTDDKATVTCPAGGLDPGASITCTATYTITAADITRGLRDEPRHSPRKRHGLQ